MGEEPPLSSICFCAACNWMFRWNGMYDIIIRMSSGVMYSSLSKSYLQNKVCQGLYGQIYLHVKRELHLLIQISHKNFCEIFDKRQLCHVFLGLGSFWILQIYWCLFRKPWRVLIHRLWCSFETRWTACGRRFWPSLGWILIIFLLSREHVMEPIIDNSW